MSASATASPRGREPIVKPSVFRRLAGLYLDALIASFFSWLICFTFSWQREWNSMALVLLVAELFWCRDRLRTTVGEFCLGIRYLTSSSSHVVADIKIVNPKLKLNDFILIAGVAEISLAFVFFSGWTFLNQIALFNWSWGPPFSFIYWILIGLFFFACGASFLSGSKNTIWIVPAVHLWLILDLLKSAQAWTRIFRDGFADMPCASALLAAWPKSSGLLLIEFFCLFSFFVISVVFLSRRQWVH
ncbi:MAG: hypothetical protein ACREL1_08215 [bacterium]